MFSYSTGYYVSPPIGQYLKFKNRCSLINYIMVQYYSGELQRKYGNEIPPILTHGERLVSIWVRGKGMTTFVLLHAQPFIWWHTTRCGYRYWLLNCSLQTCMGGGERGAVQSKFTSSKCGRGAGVDRPAQHPSPPLPPPGPKVNLLYTPQPPEPYLYLQSCSKTRIHKRSQHTIQNTAAAAKLMYIKLLMYLFFYGTWP